MPNPTRTTAATDRPPGPSTPWAPHSARYRQLADIAEAARQLRARYGRVPLYHAIEVEPWSRIPERRWALVQVPCDL